MMRVRDHEDLRRPHLPVDKSGGKVCRASCGLSRSALIILCFFVILAGASQAHGAPSFSLLQAPGGLGGTLVGSNYLNTFGSMNALGLGTPLTGLTVTALSNGAIYFTP